MIPAGPPVDDADFKRLSAALARGHHHRRGNSNYKDSIRRAETLRSQQIEFLDVGVSGGVWGLKVGFNLMVGGNQASSKQAEPIFQTLAPAEGYATSAVWGRALREDGAQRDRVFGAAELREGFEILRAAPFGSTSPQLARLWNHGSVIRPGCSSWRKMPSSATRAIRIRLCRGLGRRALTLEEAIDHASRLRRSR